MRTIADVIGWKFSYQPGMVCREVDGALRIVEFPGGIPTQAQQDQWTAEFDAAMALEQAARDADAARMGEITTSPEYLDMIARLQNATAAQINNWVENNITSLAGAREFAKRVLPVMAYILKRLP